MPKNGPNERDTKLIEWLNEAYAKEAELEADLTAHIAMTTKDSYKKRLREHLRETKNHKKQVAARIKKLGGKAETASVPGVPKVAGEIAGKGVAAVKGQVGVARAVLREETETHLRNAQEELREEHVEIALYQRIETFATEVGDRDTVQLAKSIIREEVRMAKFLDAEITRLVKEVVRREVPKDQRATPTRRRSTSARSRTSRTASSGGRSRGSSNGASSGRTSGSVSASGRS